MKCSFIAQYPIVITAQGSLHVTTRLTCSIGWCVRVGDIKSPVIVSNTGAPHGCVLSPFLCTLYTNDCRGVDPSTQYVRFSDDTAMLALFLPHTIHMFLQWYVSLVGAVTIFYI